MFVRKWLVGLKPCVVGLAVVVVLAGEAPVLAEVIQFEGVAPDGGMVAPVTPYSEAGFTLTQDLDPGGSITYPEGTDGIIAWNSGANTNGSDVFGWCGGCFEPERITLILTQDAGDPFSFQSFEASNLADAFFVTGAYIRVTGFLSGGGTLTQTFDLVEGTYPTFTLDPGFTNLDRVEFQGSEFGMEYAMDNLTLARIPAPSTLVGLVSMGLIGTLGYLWRRRRRAA